MQNSRGSGGKRFWRAFVNGAGWTGGNFSAENAARTALVPQTGNFALYLCLDYGKIKKNVAIDLQEVQFYAAEGRNDQNLD